MARLSAAVPATIVQLAGSLVACFRLLLLAIRLRSPALLCGLLAFPFSSDWLVLCLRARTGNPDAMRKLLWHLMCLTASSSVAQWW